MRGLIKAQKAIADCEIITKQLTPLLNNLIGQEHLVEKEIDNSSSIKRVAEDKSKEMEREVRRLSLAGFFAMFISIISYLRYKRTGWQGSTKVIWIDNPFGQANAGHLLGYIFELAKATNTQMICLTGLQETTIYAQFDVVYSLVHRMLSSMSIIQTKQVKVDQSIEVGYYNLKVSQMSFL